MARIRTIKLSFVRSAAMRRVSRDARLLRNDLPLLADDEGRAKGDIFYIAEELYPTDTDATMCLTSWLDELEREKLIERYTVDGVAYLRIEDWHEDQTICHPTLSKLPASPKERSRAACGILESSRNVLEKSTKPRKDKEKSGEPAKIVGIFSAPGGEAPSLEETQRRAKADLDELYATAREEGDLPTAARVAHIRARVTGIMPTGRDPAAPALRSATDDRAATAMVDDGGMPPNGMLVKPS